MTAIGQAGGANGTDIAQPEYAYFHVEPLSPK